MTSGKIQDVYIDETNITGFGRPRHIYEAKVSPDGRYLLVWHMDYPPRRVSIYDLDNKKKIATFSPGAGGKIRWAAHNLIYHQHGAGTNTAIWAIYTIDGTKQWNGYASGARLDDSGRFVFVYPTLSNTREAILVADVRDGRVLAKARPKGIANVLTFRWLDGQNVRVWYENQDGKTKSADLHLEFQKPQACESVCHVDSL